MTELVDQTVRIAASPEVVFEYFIDPRKLVTWLGSSAELEPRPKGKFLLDMNGTDVAVGEFVEVDPPRRVVFTWGWAKGGAPVAPGSSTVEVTLTPEGDNTVVRLVHRNLPPSTAEGHGRGWAEHLATLVGLASDGGLLAG